MEPNRIDPQRADLRPVRDVAEDLNALNGLQIHRAKPLNPVELKQPLRHAHYCLPTAVKTTIYMGDRYGSRDGVFSCADDDFQQRATTVFGNQVRGDGELNYNDFFRRLRRSEWLLWDVEAERGGSLGRRHRPLIQGCSTVTSDEFNRVDEWCVVSARRAPDTDAMVERVRRRFPQVLREGRVRVDRDSERNPGLWVPPDQTAWGSGLYVYAIIKALMQRVTEFHCRRLPHQTEAFWAPLPGWLNIDEVRAEMQGRAAQRCMAATGYRSRIAIEGVRRWIGTKEVAKSTGMETTFLSRTLLNPPWMRLADRCAEAE
ncbi:hypothetical protein ONZ43_g4341 [Nemania bipapillata]|uniref:Uncharacterized protein n=1 Tax=Nemania bipapillata TaxID=110536 RepID=A0ACC2IP16_9PEZI|nr:hypothetical protein ONZ43_g4341 [Nemania bipapillata]